MIRPKLKTRDKYGVFLRREYISYRYKDSVYEPEETACGERFICRLLYSVLTPHYREIVVVDPRITAERCRILWTHTA